MGATFEHGFRLRPEAVDIADLFKAIEQFKTGAMQKANELAAARLAELAATKADQATMKGEPLEKSALSLAYEELQEAHVKCQQTLRRDSANDFEVQLSLTYLDDRVYALLHAENQAYWKLLKAHPDFEYWPWYDTDEPKKEGCNSEQWAERRKKWFQTIRGKPTYTMHMTLLGSRIPTPPRDLIRSKVPPIAERAHKIAFDSLCGEAMREEWEKNQERPPSAFAMKVYLDFAKKAKEDPETERRLNDTTRFVAERIEGNTPQVLIPEETRPKIVSIAGGRAS